MKPLDQVRQLLDVVEALLPAERRDSPSLLVAGDIVQIKGPIERVGNWQGSLFRISNVDNQDRIHGVHLIDHRAGALQGHLCYQIQDLEYIGRMPSHAAHIKARADFRKTSTSFEELAGRAQEIQDLRQLLDSIKR